MYFQKYHFNFYEFGIIGKLVKSSVINAKISIFSKVGKMYLLLYWVTYCRDWGSTYECLLQFGFDQIDPCQHFLESQAVLRRKALFLCMDNDEPHNFRSEKVIFFTLFGQ